MAGLRIGPAAEFDVATRVAAWTAERVTPVSSEARLANSQAGVAGTGPAVVMIGPLASALKVPTRTVPRLAEQHIGLTPHALICRRRLQEAAEHIRTERTVRLSTGAAVHGFSDQAHLARAFQRFLGQSPKESQGLFRTTDNNAGGR